MILQTAANIVNKYGSANEEAKKDFSSWVSKNPNLSGGEKAYRYLDEKGKVYQSVSLRAPEPRTDEKFHQPLIHPITKKPCAVPPNGFSRTPDTLKDMVKNNGIIFGKDETTQPRQKMVLTSESKKQLTSVIQDAKKGKADLLPLNLDFPYCHPVSLYETLVGAEIQTKNDIVIDFFGGSGTTAHAVINLNREDGGRRKYILVEANDYFHTVILPRVKKVVFSDKWKDGKAKADGKGVSHFCKYFALEQYEDTLRRASYVNDSETDAPSFFDNPFEKSPFSAYVFLRDKKMSDALKIDYEADKITVDFQKLYPEIDWAETLSCIKGKFIKSVTTDSVTFADNETIKFAEMDYRDILPLIWWDK